MGQIIWNWTCILVLPLLAGILVRALLRRRKRAWIFTAAAAAAALALLAWAWTIPIPGNEGPGLRALQALFLTLEAGLTGLVLRLNSSR